MAFIDPRFLSPEEYDRYALIEGWPPLPQAVAADGGTSLQEQSSALQKQFKELETKFTRESKAELNKFRAAVNKISPLLANYEDDKIQAEKAIKSRDLMIQMIGAQITEMKQSLSSLAEQSEWLKSLTVRENDPVYTAVIDRWASFVTRITPDIGPVLLPFDSSQIAVTPLKDLGIPEDVWKALFEEAPELVVVRPDLIVPPPTVVKIATLPAAVPTVELPDVETPPVVPPLVAVPTTGVTTPLGVPPLPTPVPSAAASSTTQPPLAAGPA